MKHQTAALIALLAAAALAAQFAVTRGLPQFDSTTAVVWAMAGYFTVLTNLCVAVVFAAIAAGMACSVAGSGAITLAIIGVGGLYHALLAGMFAHQGLAWWADQGLHTAVPVAVALWWLTFVRQGRLAMLPLWLFWPTIYVAYALTRGAWTGFWPYPFLDAETRGWATVALTLPALFATFAALGLAMIGVARVSR